MRNRLWTICVVAAVALVLVLLLIGKRNCDRRGGQYVRGIFFMTCVVPTVNATGRTP